MVEILSSRVILRPSNYDATLSFYRDTLGLAIYREYPGGTVFFAGQSLIEVAGHHTGAGSGSERAQSDADSASGVGGALWLQVRDVFAVESELTDAGVSITRGAQTEPWGLIELWITDPDGVPIVLVEIPEDHPLRKDLR